jgi:phosphatidylserine decarboxylase
MARGESVRTMKSQRWPLAREGFPFLLFSSLLTVVLWMLGWKLLGVVGILLTLFIAYFFRNPRREIPSAEKAILAPADGRIVHVGECLEDRFLKATTLKVSIFMSVFDVHLNRAPASGRIVERSYNPGKFLVASREKSSLLNEQNALLLETDDRWRMVFIQIAGLIARRIVCYAKAGDALTRGEIFGMIRFGSRIDLYLPPDVKPLVQVGQHVKGGESIIGVRP